MNKEHFGQIIMAGIRYFFNIDPFFCKQAFFAALLLSLLCETLATRIVACFRDGINTVYEDAREMKAIAQAIIVKVQNVEFRENLINNIRNIGINPDSKDLGNWQ